MSNAEKRACQYTGYCRNQSYKDYLNGYHQAEKDLKLGWKDIKKLRELISIKKINDGLFEKEDYEEVLKRFLKERKEK